MTDQKAVLDALHEKATPGEWSVDRSIHYRRPDNSLLEGPDYEGIWMSAPGYFNDADASFIAAAHNAWESLSAELERLRAEKQRDLEFIEGHPGMCCGQCYKSIRDAEAELERLRALRGQSERFVEGVLSLIKENENACTAQFGVVDIYGMEDLLSELKDAAAKGVRDE